MNIVKRNGNVVEFDHNKVSAVIKKAFDANQTEITDDMLTVTTFNAIAEAQKVMKETGKPLHVEMMQDAVEKTLMKYGFTDIAKSYILYRKERAKIRNTKLDVSKVVESYVKKDDWRVKENSTVNYSVGGFILSNSGAITANYWLDHYYDEEIANAHRNCDIHLHDLSFLGPYCAGWSLKQLIVEGLGGVPGKISSKPANHLHTLCNQMVNFLGITQNEWCGAQAFSSFDTYLAPFVRVDNLSYNQVKQCIQSFVFGVNTPSRWGCVDEDTEVLTTIGFKRYNELQKGDLIYSWKDGSLVINPVNEVVIKNYKGKMHSYRAPGYYQFVSPDHRVLIGDGNGYRIVLSEQIMNGTVKGDFPLRFLSTNIDPRIDKLAYREKSEIIYMVDTLINGNPDERITSLNVEDSRKFLYLWMERTSGYINNEKYIDILQHAALRALWTSYVIHTQDNKVQIKLNSEFTYLYEYNMKEVDYDGVIWCPNVNSGTAVFRKDKSVFISGQCQAPFTNVTIDWTCPDDLRDIPAIVGGIPQDFTYGDCKKEMDMVNKAFMEVMIEGDANGRGHQYPIPTYSITKDFDWTPSENLKMLFEMSAKYGIPYFSNYVNSDMNPGDVRSMAILGNQEVIYKDKFGRVSKNQIMNLVEIWLKSEKKPEYKILMNGEFVNVTEMFQIPYDDYETYVEIELTNGYKQSFSYDHKCMIVRDGVMMEELSQNVREGDKFLMARHPYNKDDDKSVGNYELGKIVGYYLAEGYQQHDGANITFDINIERTDIVHDIEVFFDKIGCRVTSKPMKDCNIFKVMVYGREAYELVGNFVSGLTAEEKRLTSKVYDTTESFRRGMYDGYLDTDGSERNRVFAHTSNKKLCKDLITLGSTIGRYFRYYVNSKNTRYFKPDKSDLIHFESYELDIIHPGVFNDDYFVIPVKYVSQNPSKAEFVYNFTVDTKEHLYTLPNGIITHQCCRLRLDLTELARKNGGFFGSGESTGSIGVVTINLPKLAYESKSEEEFYEKLDKLMDVVARSLDIKRRVCTELLESGFFPYTKRYLGHFNNHFSTFGVVGMNEAGLNARWLRTDMTDKRTQKWAEDILNHMRSRLIKYQQQYGCLFNLESTPAESTAYRFAKHDKERYPDIKTANDNGTPYYTNSTNLPVGCTDDVFEALDVQDSIQILYNSGTVFHTYLGERLYDWKSAAKLIRAICTNYRLPYITLSPTYSICTEHGYLVGEHPTCPYCGKKTEVYSRITGYYRAIQNWNDGKAQEFEDRNEYKIDDSVSEQKITNYESMKEESECESCKIPEMNNEESHEPKDKKNDSYLLITTSTCPNCRIVKSFINTKHPKVDIKQCTIDIDDDPDIKEFVKKNNITSAPVLVTPAGKEISRMSEIIEELTHWC